MTTTLHLDTDRIDAAMAAAGASPGRVGTVDMIVRRPDVDAREVLDVGELVVGRGLEGDNYVERGSPQTDDGRAHPEAQLNIMNSRNIGVLSGGDRERWPLAGDQFFVDLDVSVANLPVGTRLRIGSAVIEVAAKPHNGCAKFAERFGKDAARWVNQSRELRRRGLCAVVVEAGTVSTGDEIRVIE
ncbi:MOSC domain-containing protein [Ilumatobacter sp.]|uniref:MOSC domain-containing protein n=1 Tax=Ilumatobacter sp. TaxID=1967498 RepID=UPI003AF9A811